MSEFVDHEELFGPLEFDKSTKTFKASLIFTSGEKITVDIDSMGVDPDDALQRSHHIYNTIEKREREYRRAAASELLGLYNDNWSNGEVLNIDSFEHRLSLLSISIAPLELGQIGCVSLYYSDGGLFGGHFIDVILGTDFSYRKADLVG